MPKTDEAIKAGMTHPGTLSKLRRFAVAPSGCWEWTGGKNENGYGTLYHDKVLMLAHRFSYAVHSGVTPDSQIVCHRCDNPKCVNPDHLFIGTRADNNRDMRAKGRHKPPTAPPQKGAQNHNAVLTEALVIEGRKLRAEGQKYRVIAERLGVEPNAIWCAITGKSWAHISAGIVFEKRKRGFQKKPTGDR